MQELIAANWGSILLSLTGFGISIGALVVDLLTPVPDDGYPSERRTLRNAVIIVGMAIAIFGALLLVASILLFIDDVAGAYAPWYKAFFLLIFSLLTLPLILVAFNANSRH